MRFLNADFLLQMASLDNLGRLIAAKRRRIRGWCRTESCTIQDLRIRYESKLLRDYDSLREQYNADKLRFLTVAQKLSGFSLSDPVEVGVRSEEAPVQEVKLPEQEDSTVIPESKTPEPSHDEKSAEPLPKLGKGLKAKKILKIFEDRAQTEVELRILDSEQFRLAKRTGRLANIEPRYDYVRAPLLFLKEKAAEGSVQSKNAQFMLNKFSSDEHGLKQAIALIIRICQVREQKLFPIPIEGPSGYPAELLEYLKQPLQLGNLTMVSLLLELAWEIEFARMSSNLDSELRLVIATLPQ